MALPYLAVQRVVPLCVVPTRLGTRDRHDSRYILCVPRLTALKEWLHIRTFLHSGRQNQDKQGRCTCADTIQPMTHMQESRASILDIGPLARRSFLTLIHASNRRGSESLEQSYDSCCWSSGFVFISLSLSSSVRRKRVEAGMRNCRATKYATRYAGASRRRSRRCDSSCALAAASKSAMSPSDAKPALARAYFPASELDSSVVAASACATNSQDVLASAARSSTTRLDGDINAAALAFIVATRSSVAALVLTMRAGCRFVRAPQAQRLRNVHVAEEARCGNSRCLAAGGGVGCRTAAVPDLVSFGCRLSAQ